MTTPSSPVRLSPFGAAVLLGPIWLFMAFIWLVRPLSVGGTLSLTFAVPVFFVVALFVFPVPRSHFRACLGTIGFESLLLLVILVFSMLSLMNADEPIRGFRIIYPSELPFALFLHLAVLSSVAPGWLMKVPRWMIVSAAIFGVFPLLASLGLAPLRGMLFELYRLRGFLENSLQLGIALGVTLPFVVTEFALAKRPLKKIGWAIFLLAMLYTQFRTGSKTPLAISAGLSFLLYLSLTFRTQNFRRILPVLAGLVVLFLLVWWQGLNVAERIDPIVAGKIREILSGGISNYQSIQSRKELWAEAISQGQQHWFVGSGAGEKILGVSHAHNLVLDYFKGIGLIGAVAITLLCLTILARSVGYGVKVWRKIFAGTVVDDDFRILACYTGAVAYVICNQLSDCFGPSTVGFLWVVYLTGRLCERNLAGTVERPLTG